NGILGMPERLGRCGVYTSAMADEKESLIVEARMMLLERFLDRMKGTPGASDARPEGHGPLNRHGMPKVPEGQTPTKGWPVLDLRRQPNVPISKWELSVDVAVEESQKPAAQDFIALPQA